MLLHFPRKCDMIKFFWARIQIQRPKMNEKWHSAPKTKTKKSQILSESIIDVINKMTRLEPLRLLYPTIPAVSFRVDRRWTKKTSKQDLSFLLPLSALLWPRTTPNAVSHHSRNIILCHCSEDILKQDSTGQTVYLSYTIVF